MLVKGIGMEIIEKEKLIELRELSNGSDDLIKTLLDKYIVNTQGFIEQINAALAAKDYEKVLFGVHTVKGSSLSLGLITLGQKFTELNARAKAGDYKNFEFEMASISLLLKDVISYRATLG